MVASRGLDRGQTGPQERGRILPYIHLHVIDIDISTMYMYVYIFIGVPSTIA